MVQRICTFKILLDSTKISSKKIVPIHAPNKNVMKVPLSTHAYNIVRIKLLTFTKLKDKN